MKKNYSKPCAKVYAVKSRMGMMTGSNEPSINIGGDKGGENTAGIKDMFDDSSNSSIWN